METHSPPRCLLVTLVLSPRHNEWESQQWRRVGRKQAFLRDLTLSLFSSVGGLSPPLFPLLPFALGIFLTELRSLISSGASLLEA